MASRDDASITAPVQTLPRQLARVHGPSYAITVAWGASSDMGPVRAANEDSTCVSAPVCRGCRRDGRSPGRRHRVGAGRGCLRSVRGGPAVDGAPLHSAVASANRLIFEQSRRSGQVMGTTVSGIAFTAGPSPTVTVFNIGDSRTYVRDPADPNELRQVTVDHSYVQELYDAGEITLDEARTHADRNLLTRALGVDLKVEVDVQVWPAQVSQRWLVCSDGLTAELSIAEIRSCLELDDAQVAADGLVSATLTGAARDNVSVVVVDVIGVDLVDDPDRTDPRPRSDVGSQRLSCGTWSPARGAGS